jgi:hypothetical protein
MKTKALAVVALLVGVGGFAWLLSAPVARAQAISYETGSEVTVTCAAAGTTFSLTAGLGYVAHAANEGSSFKLNNTNGDGGFCGAGGTPLDVGAAEFIVAKKPSDALTTVGVYKGCCRSAGGTGTIIFTPAKTETR